LRAVVLINPQIVNVSSRYSGSALFLAVIAFCCDPREMKDHAQNVVPNPGALGMLYAAVIALKTTFASI
jgi:hypothetical protein